MVRNHALRRRVERRRWDTTLERHGVGSVETDTTLRETTQSVPE